MVSRNRQLPVRRQRLLLGLAGHQHVYQWLAAVLWVQAALLRYSGQCCGRLPVGVNWHPGHCALAASAAPEQPAHAWCNHAVEGADEGCAQQHAGDVLEALEDVEPPCVARGLRGVGGQHYRQVAAAVQVRLLAVHGCHHLGHCIGLQACGRRQLLRHSVDLGTGVQDLKGVHATACVGRGEEHATVGVGADDGQAACLWGACQQARRAVLITC